METIIRLNDLKYRFDVYQMFNIYYPLNELKFEEDGDYEVNVNEKKVSFRYKDFYKEATEFSNLKETLKRIIFTSLKEITGDYYPWGILVGIRPSKIALTIS